MSSYQQIELFKPSRKSGVELRQLLNTSFAESLGQLVDACRGHVCVPTARIDNLVHRIEQGSRETPYLFSLYFKLVDAIQSDQLSEAENLFATIGGLGKADKSLLVTSFAPGDFPWDIEMVSGYFAAESDSAFRYTAPEPEGLPARRAQIASAVQLVSQTCHPLAAEIEELITTIIIARGIATDVDGSGEEPRAFQGASALRAFGAIVQDAEPDTGPIDCAASLIHEEAHNVLFALSPMEGVVENSDEERFSSPLRDDLRPLEGIFHATFVLARMVYGMTEMLASGKLSPQQNNAAEEMRDESVPLFFDGLDTVRQHGILTPQGAWALCQAEEYMAQFK